jgi:hypothetical protein
MMNTLRMIDARYAYWQQGHFRDYLEKAILSKKMSKEDEQERLRGTYGEGGFETDEGHFFPESWDPS